MTAKSTTKIAQQLLDRFFRDAEGKTNRQLDVYFTLQDLDIPRDKADPALEYLVSRGLINQFGPDIAFLTDKGASAIVDEMDVSALPKAVRDFVQKPIPPMPSPQAEPAPKPAPPARPKVPLILYFDVAGNESIIELGWVCSVGRSEDNTIPLDDQRASKHHIEIRYEGGQYVLHDLGSANGTLLNGDYVKKHVLKSDDEIIIGRSALIFQAPPGVLPEPAGEPPVGGEATLPPRPSPAIPPYPAPAPVVQDFAPPERPIPVVKGRPEPAPPIRPPSEDLFADTIPPRDEVGSPDLFAEEPVAARDREASEDDLFAFEPTPVPDVDPAPAQGGDVLFGEPSYDGGGDDLFAEERRTSPSPLPKPPSDAMMGEATIADPSSDSDRFVGEPFSMETDAQPGADEWTEARVDTHGDSWDGNDLLGEPQLLSNQPVRGGQQPAPEEDDDAATVMVSRDSIFGDEPEDAAELSVDPGEESPEPVPMPEPSQELPRWGEQPAPLGSHPEFAADIGGFQEQTPAEVGLDSARRAAEAMPVADLGLADEGPANMAVERLFQLLATLRPAVERARIPDRARLLEAIDLLRKHPFVREALEQLER